MTNINVVEKMAELMQQMEENSPRVAALQYSLKLVGEKMEEGEKRIAELEARCAALAAENAGLKKFCKDAAFDADYEAELGMERGGFTDALNDIKTPATDAFLAEVRASAIDSLVDLKTKQLAYMHPDTHAFGAIAMTIRSQINELQMFATEIRKGVQS